MSGDYTRFGFDPLKRYSGVLMQQGRVQLDSDWNEEIDILKRRQRTTTLDMFGPLGIPYSTSPDAFLVGLIPGPPPDLSIGTGRLYVDGIQIEAFEGENATYLTQPFLPTPLAEPLPQGDVVVYLDVWEREVTYIEDPTLLDVALGGADTTTRIQTVWQLRIDPRDRAACGADIGEPPSAGRLTTAAIAPPDPDDPCILPPVGGYRGLENRLYRIEVHEGGPLGTASFKWSRDNGSIVSVVRSIAVSGTQTTLAVNRIGRDQFMRFQIGDWVTVTDDHRELMGEPGEMAMVADIDDANLRIVLDRAIPSGGARAFGANDDEVSARHTRIQKWDQTAAANPGLDPTSGLITTAAGPIAIEAGIEIRFATDPAGGSFRTGDYWVFWARTATAEIEILTAAPPRGIQHHYVQIAAITGLGTANPTVSDCRPPPPAQDAGDCCCTIIVRPGEDIQAGIDALPPQGGCVCLKTGLHVIRAPLRIARGNIVLKAESPGTTVRIDDVGSALVIGNPTGALVDGVDVLGIVFEAVAIRDPEQGVVTVNLAANIRIAHCAMRSIKDRQVTGLTIIGSDHVSILSCRIDHVSTGIWVVERCQAFCADGNVIDLNLGRGEDGTPGLAGILIQRSAFACRITRNLVEGALLGIVLNDDPYKLAGSRADQSIITDNLVEMPLLADSFSTTAVLPGIDCAADLCTIAGNKIRYRNRFFSGIRITGSLCGVTGNTLISGNKDFDASGPVAIRIGATVDDKDIPVLGCVVTGNIMSGVQHGLFAIGAGDLVVKDNVLAGFGLGYGILGSRLRGSLFAGNRFDSVAAAVFLIDGNQNRIAENDIRGGQSGISLLREWGPAIVGNRINDLETWGVATLLIIGRCEIIDNRVVACGRAMAQTARAIALMYVAGEAHVVGNEIMDTGSLPEVSATTDADYGIYGDLILEARVSNNLVTYSNALSRDPNREDRALAMRGWLEWEISDNLVIGFAIQVQGNKFIGTGQTALVELREGKTETAVIRFERVLFDQNYCMHVSPRERDERRATVSLTGRAASVSGNHIKATTRRYFSVNFNGMPGPYMGNITAGETLQHTDFPAPASAFNIITP